jgi:histone H3/H4
MKTLKYNPNQHYIMSNDTTFTMAAVVRLMKNAGVTRVSKEAAIALDTKLAEIGTDLAKRATELAVHAKRSTVRAEDINLAASQ